MCFLPGAHGLFLASSWPRRDTGSWQPTDKGLFNYPPKTLNRQAGNRLAW